MNRNLCYFDTEIGCDITQDIFDYIQDNNDWTSRYSFSTLILPDKIIKKDKFLNIFSKEIGIKSCVIKLNPYSFADWHKDVRPTAINALLKDYKSFTVFSYKEVPNSVIQNCVYLEYIPNRYYLLNTKIDHTVFNFNETRYLLSVEPDENSYIDVAALIMKIKNENLHKYERNN